MMDAKTERDIWLELFEREKRDLIAKGMSPEEADDKASAKVRREIRGSPSRDPVGDLAHLLTGYIAATCCHVTGGHKYSRDPQRFKYCECRSIAEGLIEERERVVALLYAEGADEIAAAYGEKAPTDG